MRTSNETRAAPRRKAAGALACAALLSAPTAEAAPPRSAGSPAAAQSSLVQLPPELRPSQAAPEGCPFCQITPGLEGRRSDLAWHNHWETVGTREYLTVSALVASIVGFRLLVPPPKEPSWSSPVLFDRALGDAVRFESASARDTAATISDGLFLWEILHPAVLDPLVFAWWQRESPMVAWQMFVINAQAYSMTMLMNDVTKRLVGRQRPYAGTEQCLEGDPSCSGTSANMSFYSGHAAITATGAGLICAHHTQLRLYQNPWLDTGTCALAVAGTAATGVLRMASENHWASDVIVGHLLGYASGYLIPTLFYYKQFRAVPEEQHPTGPIYATLPMLTTDSIGITVLGAF